MSLLICDHLGVNGGLIGYTRSIVQFFSKTNKEIIVCSTEDLRTWSGGGLPVPVFRRFSQKSKPKLIRFLYLIVSCLQLIYITRQKVVTLSVMNVFHFSFIEYLICLSLKTNSKNVLIVVHDFEDLDGRRNIIFRHLFSRIFLHRNVKCASHSCLVLKGLSKEFKTECFILPHLDFSYDYDPGLQKEIIYDFLMYGKMKTTKGYWDFLEAARDIRRKGGKFKFYLGGLFPLDEFRKVKQFVKHENLVDYVVLENSFMSDERVSELIDRSRWIVLPYHMVYSSGILLRSIERETPVIHSDLNSFNVITNGKNVALTFKPGQPLELAKAMIKTDQLDYNAFRDNVCLLKDELIEKNDVLLAEDLAQYLQQIGLN